MSESLFPVQVVVAREDVWRGLRQSCTDCSGALALARACQAANLPTVVSIFDHCAVVYGAERSYWAALPNRVQNWIHRYDRHRPPPGRVTAADGAFAELLEPFELRFKPQVHGEIVSDRV